MTTFAATFREIVIPDMRRLIAATAPCVAMCVMTFAEARNSIVAAAIKRGATSLPEEVFQDFRDWVADQLFHAVDAWEDANPANEAAASAARDRWA
jgi:hypothetical protein